MRRVLVLGSTGSIGRQTLDVIERMPDDFRVVGLAAGGRAEELARQAQRFGVRDLALADASVACGVEASLRRGPDSAEQLVREVEADIVVASIVGSSQVLTVSRRPVVWLRRHQMTPNLAGVSTT